MVRILFQKIKKRREWERVVCKGEQIESPASSLQQKLPSSPHPPPLSQLRVLEDISQSLEGRTLQGSEAASAKSWTTLQGESRFYFSGQRCDTHFLNFSKKPRILSAYSPEPHLEWGNRPGLLGFTFTPAPTPWLRAYPLTSPSLFSPLFTNGNNSVYSRAFKGLNTTTETA